MSEAFVNIFEILTLVLVLTFGIIELKHYADEARFRKKIKELGRENMVSYFRYMLENEPEEVDIKSVRNTKEAWNVDEDMLPEKLIRKVEQFQNANKATKQQESATNA